MKNKKRKINKQSGAAMLVAVIFFLFISISIIAGLVSPSLAQVQDSSTNLKSKQSYFLAESGSEDALYRISNNMTIGSSETITLGSNSTTTTISTTGSNQKEIISTGNVSNYDRKTDLILQSGAGVGFNYGIQAGDGGFTLSGGSKITGNVYANGNIQADGGVKITGTAIAAGATSYIGDGIDESPWMGTVVVGTGSIGDAWAYKVIGGKVAGNLYCQTGSQNNKTCNTTHGIPPTQPLPFTQDNIDAWKAEGTAGGVISNPTGFTSNNCTANNHCPCPGNSSSDNSAGNCIVDWRKATLGPGKINGNLTVTDDLILTGTIYVVGNVTVSNGGTVKLPSNFNQYSATLISDKWVSLDGGSYTGSGAAGSYLFVVSNSTCPVGSGCSGHNAIDVGGGSGTIAVAAQNGTVDLGGGISINSAVGKTISAHNGANIFYETGLASPSFQSGPSGGWNVLGWKEAQ